MTTKVIIGGKDGRFRFKKGKPTKGWKLEFNYDKDGIISGESEGYVPKVGKFERKYSGKYLKNGELSLKATFSKGSDDGQVVHYKGSVIGGQFEGTMEIVKAGKRGLIGSGVCRGPVIEISPTSKRRISIGGKTTGWYQYTKRDKKMGFVLDFIVDGNGRVSGSNESYVARVGRFKKVYSGSFLNGRDVNIKGVIVEGKDKGQEMVYLGRVKNGEFTGTVEITKPGARGFTGSGTCGGPVKEFGEIVQTPTTGGCMPNNKKKNNNPFGGTCNDDEEFVVGWEILSGMKATFVFQDETIRDDLPLMRKCPYCKTPCTFGDACKHTRCGNPKCLRWFCHVCLRVPERPCTDEHNCYTDVNWGCGNTSIMSYRQCPNHPNCPIDDYLFPIQTDQNEKLWYVGM